MLPVSAVQPEPAPHLFVYLCWRTLNLDSTVSHQIFIKKRKGHRERPGCDLDVRLLGIENLRHTPTEALGVVLSSDWLQGLALGVSDGVWCETPQNSWSLARWQGTYDAGIPIVRHGTYFMYLRNIERLGSGGGATRRPMFGRHASPWAGRKVLSLFGLLLFGLFVLVLLTYVILLVECIRWQLERENQVV
jgi:hypothetical protein